MSKTTADWLPFAFVDLETTGATPTRDRITEIGIVEVAEDGTVSEWSTLVNPEISIPGFIQSMTGITDAMVEDAPSFKDVADEVIRRLPGRLFIAHNARFDYGFLKNEFRRLGIDFRATVACTVKLSRRLFPGHPKHGLGACVGEESLVAHTLRLAQALAKLKLKTWPFHGPACSKEGEDVLVVDQWCYLGTAKSADALWDLLENGRPQFDRDTNRILAQVANRMVPLGVKE